MRIARKSLVLGAAAVMLSCGAAAAQGADYFNGKNVTFIVATAPEIGRAHV